MRSAAARARRRLRRARSAGRRDRLQVGCLRRRQREPRGCSARAKLIDLRIPSGKPGVDGAKALEACAAQVERRSDPARRAAQDRSRDAGIGVVLRTRTAPASPSPSTRSSATRCPRGSPRASLASASAVAPETLAVPRRPLRGQPHRRDSQEIEKLGLLLPEGELDAGCRRARGHRRRALRRVPVVGSVARPRRRARAQDHRCARSRGRRHAAPAVAARGGHPCARRPCRRRWPREPRPPSRCATRVSGESARRRWSARHGA